MPKHRKRRRGALLLVVLSLLVLFLLIAVTFVVVARNYKTSAKAASRIESTGSNPRHTLDDAIKWFLVGPELERHGTETRFVKLRERRPEGVESLLEDLYGWNWERGTGSIEPLAGGGYEIAKVTMTYEGSPYDVSQRNQRGYYSGGVLTALSGKWRGLSMRILDHIPDSGTTATFYVETVVNDRGEQITASASGVDLLVNGRAFSGADDPNDPVVNREVNEDYDAADGRNVYLTFIPVDASSSSDIIPAFYRPGNLTGLETARPDNITAHPLFTGSNPNFPPLGNRWDVDNDGDRIPDAVFIDVGFPIKALQSPNTNLSQSQKTYYKELIAITCIDLDGRVNVNAHGNLWHLQPATAAQYRKGGGFGPADVNFAHIFTPAEYESLLKGRYGTDDAPGYVNMDDVLSAIKNPGLPNVFGTQAVFYGYGTQADLFGRGAVVVKPEEYGQPLWLAGTFTPTWIEAVDDPYELNLSLSGPLAGADTPYTLGELEAILRYPDADRKRLSQRLLTRASTTLDGNSDKSRQSRRRITTISSHIPVIDVPWDKWPQRLKDAFVSGTHRDRMVAFQILRGLKMDLNRWMGNGRDDNNNQVVDEPWEQNETSIWPTQTHDGQSMPVSFQNTALNYLNLPPSGTGNSPFYARQAYARHLFCLMWAVKKSGGASDLSIRDMAQWAINAVDFRDPDAIMTPFEYDSNPADGWMDLDGDPSTNEGGDRRIVWGCEYPHLIITETLAFHDRRVRDEKLDTKGGDNGRFKKQETPAPPAGKTHWVEEDKTLDQYRVPQGTLIVELYCTGPRPTNNPNPPRELYTVNNGQTYLDLGRLAPADTNGVQYPVWRMGITQATDPNDANDPSIRDRFQEGSEWEENADFLPMPVQSGVDPLEQQNHLLLSNASAGAGSVTQIERIVWFTPMAPTPNHHPATAYNPPIAETIYYNRSPISPNAGMPVGSYVLPGSYVTVGPREETYLGSQTGSPVTPSPQKVQLVPNGPPQLTDVAGSPTIPTPPSVQPTCIIAASPNPTSAGGADWNDSLDAIKVYNNETGVGISVSEPLPTKYYEPPHSDQSDGTHPIDAYLDQAAGTLLPRDNPYERNGAGGPFPLNEHNGYYLKSGGYEDYKTALIQRLADPTQAWHPTRNPYLTVDWMSIDLTVFNGEDDGDVVSNYNSHTFDKLLDDTASPDDIVVEPGTNNPVATDPEFDPDDLTPFAIPPYKSRQRGEMVASVAQDIWHVDLLPSDTLANPAASSGSPRPIFNYSYDATSHTFGSISQQIINAGQPGQPGYPWLTWYNRPFASAMELMLVPKSSPGRLLKEFSVRQTADPYTLEPFGHLVNFYDDGLGVYRLFDFVDVPSRFVGTEKWYNPTQFASSAPVAHLWPPYNKLSRFRQPGHVNVNTIVDPDPAGPDDAAIWRAISRLDATTAQEMWKEIRDSRGNKFGQPFRGFTSASDIEDTLLRPGTSEPKLIYSKDGVQFQDPEKDAVFEFDGIQQVYNSLTTKSNCFAIWITVGNFEVYEDAAGVWRLGQELRADTGEVERHRAFYIVDRSVPVGFEPGKRHNIDRCILLKRFLD
jgi:hypothetical protein